MSSELDAALTALVEALAVETDPVARARCLVRAAGSVAPVTRACLWATDGERWTHLAQEGPGRPEVGPAQLEAALAGAACLPSHQVVAHLGARCLALEGLAPGNCPDDARDQLEALLLTASMDATPEAEELIDLILPALPGDEPLPGTHAPSTPDLTDLRHLLEHLATGQEQGMELDALEAGYERAGDLLLDELSGECLPPLARLDEVLEPLWASLGRPRELDLEPEALCAPLRLTAAPLLSLLMLARRVTGEPPFVPTCVRAVRGDDHVLVTFSGRTAAPQDGPVEAFQERARIHAVRVRIEVDDVQLWLPLRRDA